VLARLQRFLGSQPVVAARVLLGGLEVHSVLAAHAVLDGTAAVRRIRAARDLEVPVVVVAARLEPYQRRVVRGPRAVESGLLVRDPVLGFPAPEDELALGIEEAGAELDGPDGGGELHGLAAGEIREALPCPARSGRGRGGRGARPGGAAAVAGGAACCAGAAAVPEWLTMASMIGSEIPAFLRAMSPLVLV